MTMYLCKLISKSGYRVKESFYREGDSEKALLADLESFSWPAQRKGDYWEITDPSICVEDLA